ncbi:hypothetical protein GALL_479930 [mine drainage metagenome]|uniref:Uncharacterized protein n=1 Tax=mine drainage metagenome TaxID=410659 RepID=A0A1J5PGQ8_9ZZZZ
MNHEIPHEGDTGSDQRRSRRWRGARGRRADRCCARRRVRCLCRALRTPRRGRARRRETVLHVDRRRRGRRVRGVHQGVLGAPVRRRPGRRLPRLPLHGGPPAGDDAQGRPPTGRPDGRRRDPRVRARHRCVDRGARDGRVRAQRRVPRLRHPSGALASGALVHRGREPVPGSDRSAARPDRQWCGGAVVSRA